MEVVEVNPGRQLSSPRIDDQRSSIPGSRQSDAANYMRTRYLRNAIRLPVMVGVTVRDDNMRNRGPLFFRNQTFEGEYPEILARVNDDSGVALLDEKSIIEIMGDLHAWYP